MTNEQMQPIDILDIFEETTDILLDALSRSDFDKAHEAISILLMQGMDMYGIEHPLMQQCFPVWDAIKNHIDSEDIARALSQTKTWKKQLAEVRSIASSN